jgi:UDP-3-O-[3-hydroxymyristoyl] glucosamine N-acyltransferase
MILRRDLIDAEIAIVTSDLLDHFCDNFDKSSFHDDFINWMQESEIIEDRVRVFEVKQPSVYFAKVSNPRIYGQVTKDVLQRKVFPLVIDKRALDPVANYRLNQAMAYIEKSALLDVTAQVTKNTVIGAKTDIGPRTTIDCSSVGSECKIGENVQIRNCIIGNDVVIEDGCKLTDAIVMKKCTLRSGCEIKPGAMIDEGVIVAKSATIAEETICSHFSYDKERKKFIHIAKMQDVNFADDDLEVGVKAFVPRELQLKSWELMGSKLQQQEPEEESDLDLDLEESEDDPEEEFMKEARAIFLDSQAQQEVQKLSADRFNKNVSAEIRSCKLSYNVDNSVVLETLVPLLLKTVSIVDTSALAVAQEVDKTLTFNSGLLREFCHEDNEMKFLLEEIECYFAPPKAIEKGKSTSQISEQPSIVLPFHIILQSLHKVNILSKEAILTWYTRVTASKGEAENGGDDDASEEIEGDERDEVLEIIGEERRSKHIMLVKKFVEFLQTKKEEESESDSDCSDSSSSDSDSSSSSNKSKGKKSSNSSSD